MVIRYHLLHVLCDYSTDQTLPLDKNVKMNRVEKLLIYPGELSSFYLNRNVLPKIGNREAIKHPPT